MFVSTLACMHHVWTLYISSLCVLMASVTIFTLTGMVSIDCWLSVAGLSVGCIGAVVALSFSVIRKLISACLFSLYRIRSVCASVSNDFWASIEPGG